jgi:adenine phosphoribosyltransferase
MVEELKPKIREIRDFPKKGVNFKDIAPLFEDSESFRKVVDLFFERAIETIDQKVDKIVAVDARGFLIASALAYKLKVGVVMARKKGKLPFKTVSCDYGLEYGSETLEMHIDSVKAGENVLIVDDVLATGGTALAVANLVKKLQGKVVGVGFLIELSFLGGRKKLKNYCVFSLISYED